MKSRRNRMKYLDDFNTKAAPSFQKENHHECRCSKKPYLLFQEELNDLIRNNKEQMLGFRL